MRWMREEAKRRLACDEGSMRRLGSRKAADGSVGRRVREWESRGGGTGVRKMA
jgi:hypothetical protein